MQIAHIVSCSFPHNDVGSSGCVGRLWLSIWKSHTMSWMKNDAVCGFSFNNMVYLGTQMHACMHTQTEESHDLPEAFLITRDSSLFGRMSLSVCLPHVWTEAILKSLNIWATNDHYLSQKSVQIQGFRDVYSGGWVGQILKSCCRSRRHLIVWGLNTFWSCLLGMKHSDPSGHQRGLDFNVFDCIAFLCLWIEMSCVWMALYK